MPTDPSSPRRRLRELLAGEDLIVAPGVFDGVSASLVARGTFRVAYMTGAGVAAFGFGLPDIGLVTQTEMTERARMLVRALGPTPLIADADTGYGAPMNVARTVHEYEAAGVAGIQLEDQVFPKRCGHLPDKELISVEENLARLGAAIEARTDPDLVLVARTDARGPLGIDEAIERANRYAAAGADLLFVEAPRSVAEIERIAAEVKGPLLINNVLGGLTPQLPAERLAELGYRIAIHPSLPARAVASAMAAALTELGGGPLPDVGPQGPAAIFELVGLTEWSDLANRHRPPPPG
jgi:2-methylisocitrate lyase-like PEP mutase family enzyme